MEKKLLEDANRANAMTVPRSIIVGSLAQDAIGFTKVEIIGGGARVVGVCACVCVSVCACVCGGEMAAVDAGDSTDAPAIGLNLPHAEF